MMMFKGVPVFNPRRPRNYLFGGKVRSHPARTRRQLANDSVHAILMPNEIVIPVKYADRVARFLKQEGIRLPNM